MSDLEKLIEHIGEAEAASTAKRAWHPSECGDIDIRIASDGTWHHEGRPFQRESLVKLFASVLRREADGHYYLLTPAEKMRIIVDDAPFVAVRVDQINEQEKQALLFTTNLGDQVIADVDHPIWVEQNPQTGEPRPYLQCRDNLHALIARAPFMELVTLADSYQRNNKTYLAVESLGQSFDLGAVDEE